MRPITKRHKPNIITVLTGDTEDIIDVSSLEDLRKKKVTNDEKDEEETEPIKLEPELKTESKLESEQETVKEEIKSKKKKIKKTKTRTVVTDRNLTNDDIDNEDEKTFSPEEVEFVTEMNQWLLETDLGLEAGPITKVLIS